MGDPDELVIHPRPLYPPSRERIMGLVAYAFVIPLMVVLRLPIYLVIGLTMLAIAGIAYRAWNESRFAYLVGPYHFGYVGPSGTRRTWPSTELQKVATTSRPTAFGRENFYVLVGRDGRGLMSVRPSLITAEDLEKFWTRLGARP